MTAPPPADSESAVPPLFEIDGLHVEAAESGAEILRGVDLAVRAGQLHALMGPNGSGKSTLAAALMGSPEFRVTKGSVRFKGEDITSWPPEVRGKAGLFLAFQYPQEIPGVSMRNFLTQALQARKGADVSTIETYMTMREWMQRLAIEESLMERYLNEKFSGGEKKRNEILQMAVLEPEMAVLDETDTGLDIDSLRVVSAGVGEVRAERPEMGVLAITHFRRLLTELRPDRVHVLIDGRVADSGGLGLADRLEREGYERYGQ